MNDSKNEFTIKQETEHYSWFKLKELSDWLRILLLAFCFVYILNTYIIINANVPTGSMIPTISPGEKIIATRFAYSGEKTPQRGDIVVFRYPDNEEIIYVKRVIGIPGDEILIENGKVYINGIKLDEPYLVSQTEGNYGPYEVPEGHYFMMGDNRNNSEDSRFWFNKFVKEDKILGKVFVKYGFNKPHINKIK